MFDIFFRWRKASKCKKVMKRVQCRLKLLKNKRHSIVRQLRDDLAQLIETGREDIAFNRAEQLFKDESIITVYDLLDNFCGFITNNLSYIFKTKDCPNDINEAVSSLIFASARCGDIPELRAIRKLFEERYGQKFVADAVELFPGNLVNHQIKEKIFIDSVPDDVKYKLVDDIAVNYCVRQEILAIEYTSELQQVKKYISTHQSSDSDIHPHYGTSEGSSMLVSSANDTEMETGCVDLPSINKNLLTELYHSSSGSLPQLCGDTIVYIDDIGEFQSSTTDDGYSQDLRLFKFLSPIANKNEKLEDSCDQSCIDQYESIKNSGLSNCGKNIKASRKRSRRSISAENASMKDIEFVSYYEKPRNSSVSHKHVSHHLRKHQKETPVEESERSRCSRCFNHEMNVCSLEQPCYFFTSVKEDLEFSYRHQKSRSRTFLGCSTGDLKCVNLHQDFGHGHCFQTGESDKVACATLAQRPRGKSNGDGAIVYHVFIHEDARPDEQFRKNGAKATDSPGSCDFANGLSPNVTSSSTGKLNLPPYLRAVTMPPERSKDNHTKHILRSNSCPLKHANHVHPKLPDYDDIVATFLSLKKECLYRKAELRN
ncbi:Ist1 domain-containing protein [Cephalotus follicularis]|uniref:Ist1 domain-containing protein n=1 Tax=Cephalotus follicularis TaxID=3775 RepID=A0A1Q3CNR3_CEPFO|nr:Ist1 domain-containing protein [Cephalotus follicularis]